MKIRKNAPSINYVDFRHDSAIHTSMIAFAAPKIENLRNFEGMLTMAFLLWRRKDICG